MMRKYSILPLLVAALAVLSAVSCKKDETTETKPSLAGMTFSLDSYARGRQKITVRPYGVSHPKGGVLKYYIKASSGVVVNQPDTVEVNGGVNKPGPVSFSFTLPDSLANYTITCGAIDADKAYYASSASASITVVRPYMGGSVTGNDIDPQDPYFILDDRTAGAQDERQYFYSNIGDKDWFRNNLAYTGSGAAYQDNDVLSYCFGRYYTYEEALTACPEGWHLPSDADWSTLCRTITGKTAAPGETVEGAGAALMADVHFNGVKMWEYWPNVKITNQVGFAALPAGYANKDGNFNAFVGINNYAAFWTSTLSEDGTQAIYRYMNVNSPDLYTGKADKHSFAASVRCIR